MYTLSRVLLFKSQLMVAVSLMLFSCAQKQEIISNYNMIHKVFEGVLLPVSYGIPLNNLNNTVRIYIEGDGRGWISKYRPSSNPTPTKSLILKLMQMDNMPSIYLARPCQYHLNDNCKQQDWTEARHSKKTVDSMNATIDKIKQAYNADSFELVGHSGGGTMAVLIAAKRSDVDSIITIAANLDIEFFTEHHKVTLMKGSLNPMHYFDEIKHIPQLHLAGGLDKIVPSALIKRYTSKKPNNCVQYLEYSKSTHMEGWEKDWAQILEMPLLCQ